MTEQCSSFYKFHFTVCFIETPLNYYFNIEIWISASRSHTFLVRGKADSQHMTIPWNARNISSYPRRIHT
jgi:hypothetical protein